MKKIFTISSFLILFTVLLAGCTRRDYYSNDADYWFSKERGQVVYSDAYCSYYAVETSNGYTIIQTTGGPKPYEGDVIYGDLSRTGYMNLYNQTDGTVISGRVVDYWLNYENAQYEINHLCQ